MGVGWVNHNDAAREMERQAKQDAADLAANRRRFGRFNARGVKCNLGEVVDLSATGARVRTRKTLTGEQSLELPGSKNPVTLRATIVWAKKAGLLTYEYGLHFIDPTPDQVRAIRMIAMAK